MGGTSSSDETRGGVFHAAPAARAELPELAGVLDMIGGSAELLLSELPLDAPGRPHAERILDLRADALAMIAPPPRHAPRKPHAIPLANALADALSLALPMLPAGVRIERELAPDLPLLRAAPFDVVQAVLDVVLRLRGTLDGDAVLRIEAAHGPTATVPEPVAGRITAGRGYVVLRVATCRASAFAVSTTKLVPAERVMAAVGGAMRLADHAVELIWPTAAPAGVDLAGRSVLVLPDRAADAAWLCDALDAAGAEVSLCFDPREAIDAIREDMGLFDGVVLGPGRADLAEDLLAADAALTVAVMGSDAVRGALALPTADRGDAIAMLAAAMDGTSCAS